MERFKYGIIKERDFSATLEMTKKKVEMIKRGRNDKKENGITFMSFRA